MSNDKNRAEFEVAYSAQAVERYGSQPNRKVFDFVGGEYINGYVQCAWWGWQASLAQPAEMDGFQIARYSKRLVEQLRAEVEALREAVKFASVVMGVVAENESLAEVEKRSLLCEVRRCDAAMAAKEGA